MRFWFGWSDDSAYPSKMSASVYIESSVVSYLTAQTSRDLITASRQAITADWWQNKPRHYDAYISVLVIEEISAGHPEAASQRLNAVAALPVVGISLNAQTLAGELLAAKAVPANSDRDALHIAIAALQGEAKSTSKKHEDIHLYQPKCQRPKNRWHPHIFAVKSA